MTGLKYDPVEVAIDRKLDELRTTMRAGFAGVEAQIDSLRPPVWSPMIAALDRAEKRLTKLFFWYFMSQGIANAAIILGMLKLLR